jgi:murein DD-endopeptidase MepM/ murein hydrolase activator NlpD
MNQRPPCAHTLGGLVGDPASLIFCVRVLLIFCVPALLVVLAIAPEARASVASNQQWSWPLDGSPTVLRGFELPAAPWLAGHRGVDLSTSAGAPVRAAGAGTVTFAGWVGGLPVVAVTHPDGLRTTYQPVLASVVRGDKVTRGAILGRVSAAGSHCLPIACLHWGVRRGSAYLDPLSLVGADIRIRLLPVWSAPGSALWSDGVPPVEPDRPAVNGVLLEMCPIPGISRQGGADLVC